MEIGPIIYKLWNTEVCWNDDRAVNRIKFLCEEYFNFI